jgi:tRNA A-37 threonylcarbamoyl transferase component Bud32
MRRDRTPHTPPGEQPLLPYMPQTFHHGGSRGVSHPQLVAWLQQLLLETDIPCGPEVVVYKRRPHQLWAMPAPLELELPCRRIAIKRFGWRNRQHYLCSPLGPSKARKEYRTACHLLRHGLPTPLPLGAGEIRHRGFVQASIYVMEAIPDYITLRDYVLTQPDGPEGLAEVTELAATYVRRMHESGLWHRDLYLANFLLTGGSGTRRLYLVDLGRARRALSMPAWLRAIDLGRMEQFARQPQFLSLYSAGRFAPWFLLHIMRFHARWRAWRRRVLNVIDPLRRRIGLKN